MVKIKSEASPRAGVVASDHGRAAPNISKYPLYEKKKNIRKGISKLKRGKYFRYLRGNKILKSLKSTICTICMYICSVPLEIISQNYRFYLTRSGTCNLIFFFFVFIQNDPFISGTG